MPFYLDPSLFLEIQKTDRKKKKNENVEKGKCINFKAME